MSSLPTTTHNSSLPPKVAGLANPAVDALPSALTWRLPGSAAIVPRTTITPPTPAGDDTEDNETPTQDRFAVELTARLTELVVAGGDEKAKKIDDFTFSLTYVDTLQLHSQVKCSRRGRRQRSSATGRLQAVCAWVRERCELVVPRKRSFLGPDDLLRRGGVCAWLRRNGEDVEWAPFEKA
ncbi:hypothetical protein LTR62_004768 [Meristemomyces frigidus]|uniref:Uncharacterized protein n=1 Tax=Meristemomyces frigidus TaxID=1508187 RepID=A0AAN7TE23_9PEZI|nr:hypothetical protein LTR62_004768 [Meristemomyces frigidus]